MKISKFNVKTLEQFLAESEGRRVSFNDLNVDKNRWIRLLKIGDYDEVLENLFVLSGSEYNQLGSNSNVGSIDSLFNPMWTIWESAFPNSDSDVGSDVVVIGCNSVGGMNVIGIGDDGREINRADCIKWLSEVLKRPNYWQSGSGRFCDWMSKYSVPFVEDEDVVNKLVIVDKWLGDGWYEINRNGKMVKERIYGRPLVR